MLHVSEKALKEAFEKEIKYFRIYDNYKPNYRTSLITGKFYSKNDWLDLSTVDDVLVEQIKKFKDKGPKEKLDWPETTNQEYGWFLEPLIPYDREDVRFYHPMKVQEFINHELKIINDIAMKQPKHTGIPFKLQ